jgi:hypothetical protein
VRSCFPRLPSTKRLACTAVRGIREIEKTNGQAIPPPLITPLEMVVPWRYRSWDRNGEKIDEKPESIPPEMKA